MKIRQGFVSNSSSSSFVCVVSKSDHENIIAQLSPKEAEVINDYCEPGKVGDMEVVGYGDLSVHDMSFYSGSIGWSDEMKYDSEEFWDAVVKYKQLLKNVVTFEIDFDA